MTRRSAALAATFEQVIDDFIVTVEGLSDEDWKMRCPNEERSVGVVVKHVAIGIPFEMEVFREIAAGRQPTTITRADLADMNARDAHAWGVPSKDETLLLLRSNALAAAAEVRQLTDEQIERSGKYIEELPQPWTVEQWIERILVGHVTGHLASITATVKPKNPA